MELTRNIDGDEYTFKVRYIASGAVRMVERGNCGAFSCDLQCIIQSKNIALRRAIDVYGPGKHRIIGSREWVAEKGDYLHEQSCADASDHELGRYRRQMLNRWTNKIEADEASVERIVDRFNP